MRWVFFVCFLFVCFIEKKGDSPRKAKEGKDAEPTVDSIFQRKLRLRLLEEERRLGEGV